MRQNDDLERVMLKTQTASMSSWKFDINTHHSQAPIPPLGMGWNVRDFAFFKNVA